MGLPFGFHIRLALFAGVVAPLMLWGAASAQGSGSLPDAAGAAVVSPARSLLIPFRVHPGQIFLSPAVPSASGAIRDERFAVRAIILAGVADHPELGISVTELAGLVERMRLASVGDAVPIGVINRELSLKRLSQVGAAVTDYYRSRGLILARAFVPAQTVDDGQVVIQVLEGVLGSVRTEGQRRMDDKRLVKPFAGMIGQPVWQRRVERALLLANGYPGTQVFGVFRPGKNVGTSELLLKVAEQPLLTGQLSVDTHGSEFTGRIRTRADLSLNNPLGVGDRLSVSGLLAWDPANARYGSAEYVLPVGGPDHLLGVRFARNGFKLGGNLTALGIEGDSLEGELFLRWQLNRSRNGGRYGRLGLGLKHAGVGAPIDREDDLTVLNLEWGFERGIGRTGGVRNGSVQLVRGLEILGAMDAQNDTHSSRVGGSGESAGSVFTTLKLRYEHLQPFAGRGTVWLRAHGQYSPDLLTATEQLALGGPNTVRAYPVAEVLVDNGFSVSLAWLIRAPGIDRRPAFGGQTWGDILKASVFIDTAMGWRNEPLPNEAASERLTGVGLELRLALERITGNIQVSRPMGGNTPSDGSGSRVYFALGYAL